MYKILIVDDEKIIRHGIMNIIEWDKLYISSVLEAKNGAEAIRIFRKENPDILLTDVKMPFMDGIELSEKILSMCPKVKIIFISGFSEVNYLKAAIKNRALNYILKPIDSEELFRTIQNAIMLCEKEQEEKYTRMKLEQMLKHSLPIFRREFMNNLIYSNSLSTSELRQQFVFCNFPFESHDRFILAIISINKTKQSHTELNDSLITVGVESIIQEVINNHSQGYVFKNKDAFFIAILKLGESDHSLDNIFEIIQSSIIKYLSLNCTIAIGTPVENIFNIAESYQYAKVALIQEFYKGNNNIYYYNDGIPSINQNYELNLEDIRIFCEATFQNDNELSNAIINKIIQQLKHNYELDLEYPYSYCSFVILQIIVFISSGKLRHHHIDLFVHYQSRLFLCKTINDIEYFMLQMAEEIKGLLAENRLTQKEKIVAKIQSILLRDFSLDITINDISNELFLTPAYLCNIFKDVTKKTINEYLTDIRISEAKKLLQSHNYYLYEIASMVGYQDPKYFSKIFKKYTGFTPSEYMKKFKVK